MPRGDVVSIADRGGDYTRKPRPAVIVQSDHYAVLDSVTICPITSVEAEAPLMRVPVQPSQRLPLVKPSWIEVDKITTVRRSRIGAVIGHLSEQDIIALNGALLVLLGIA